MNITRNSPIGVIDSGIGGLTLLKCLTNKYPNENYIYLADNLYMPYGNKGVKFLTNRLLDLVNFLYNQFSVKLVILACHTASSLKLEYINSHSCVKVIGLDLSLYNNTPIIATKYTAKKYPNAISVPTLASYIENNYFDKPKLRRKLLVIKNKYEIEDNIVLGCTHYELIANLFREIYPNVILPCKEWVEKFRLDKPSTSLKGSVLMIATIPTKSYIDKLWKIYKN